MKTEIEAKVALLDSEISALTEQYEQLKEARTAAVNAQAEVSAKVEENASALA